MYGLFHIQMRISFKILKCSKKSHVDIINEEMKGISSEEEDIGIRKCRRNVFTLMYIEGTYER